MSGTVPQMPMAPGGGQQIPPQILAALMAQQQQRPVQGGPPMAPQGQPGVPQMPMNPQQTPPGMGPQSPAGAPPQTSMLPSVQGIPQPMGTPPANAQMFGRAAAGQPGAPQGRFSVGEMAHLGRFGDSIMAHLTPGEVEVPPQVQTPQLMQQLQHAFQQAGVNPQQFTAGSPQSSMNPATGAPEYNFLSALLPAALGIGGAFLGPLAAPALGIGAGLAGAVGGGLGTAAGDLLSGQGAAASALGGLGAGAGNYLLGSLLGGGGGGVGANVSQAPPATMSTQPFISTPAGQGIEAATPSISNSAGASGGVGTVPSNLAQQLATGTQNIQSPGTSIGPGGLFGTDVTKNQILGTLMGGYLGGALAPNTASPLPSGFTQGMPALNKNWGQLLGSNAQSTPTFQNYNPYSAVTGGGYSFYPPS